MTEKDGRTRVYKKGVFHTLREVMPYEVPIHCLGRRLWRGEVDEVARNVDFMIENRLTRLRSKNGPNNGRSVRAEWYVKPKSKGESFTIDRTGWDAKEAYSKLMKVLELREGRKGLTIISN